MHSDNLNRPVHAENTIIMELLRKAEGLSVQHKVLFQEYVDIIPLNDGDLGQTIFP